MRVCPPGNELLRSNTYATRRWHPFDYVCGSPSKFYGWLSKAGVPEGPELWICGDCYVGNLGPTANADGKFTVEIRDFDQIVIGNPAHDLIRLGLSLASALRAHGSCASTWGQQASATPCDFELRKWHRVCLPHASVEAKRPKLLKATSRSSSERSIWMLVYTLH
jgi:hypothetical protein